MNNASFIINTCKINKQASRYGHRSIFDKVMKF